MTDAERAVDEAYRMADYLTCGKSCSYNEPCATHLSVRTAIDRAIEAVNKAWHETMQHAIHRNHDYIPDACDGCAAIRARIGKEGE